MYLNGKLLKLGKSPAHVDRLNRTLKLRDYLPSPLPPPPAEVSWITKLAATEPLPMYLNDSLGDCVVAAAGHMEQQWNFYAGHPYQPVDEDILYAYEKVGGYDPGNPNSDNGTNMLAFLNYWRQTGLAGHKIMAFLAVDWTNDVEVRLAIQLFGNLYTGVQLPNSAQGQSAWTVPNGGTASADGQPGSWGGHCIPIVAASPLTRTCITWGTTLKMSHNFLHDYGDEAYVVLSPDWINAAGLSASGFNLTQLQVDLAEITA
jgi:hypothetical protein